MNVASPLNKETTLNIFSFSNDNRIPKIINIIAAITILDRNTKVKVHSPYGDTEYLNIVVGVLQGDTLAPYLFIICQDYMLRTSIDPKNKVFNSFVEKGQSLNP